MLILIDMRVLALIALVCAALAGAQAAAPAAAGIEIDRLHDRIRPWMSRELGIPEQRIDFPPVDQRLRAGRCDEPPTFDFPFANRDLVRVRCALPEWQLFVRTMVREERRQIVASRSLESGTILSESDLVLRISEGSAREGFEDRSGLVGRILRRPLQSGAVLLATDLDQALQVFRIRLPIRAGQPIGPGAVSRDFVPRSALGGAMPAPGAPAAESVALRDLEPGRILMADDWSPGQWALVARTALAAGRTLDASLFDLALIPARPDGASYLTDSGKFEHLELNRSLRPGEPLSASSVRPVVLVQRGQSVVLTRRRPGSWELSVRAEALEDGRFGERVRLRNPESGKTLTARVTAREAAQLDD